MPKPISASSADVAGPPSPPNPYDPFPATVDQTPPGVIFRTLWSEADATNRFPAPSRAMPVGKSTSPAPTEVIVPDGSTFRTRSL